MCRHLVLLKIFISFTMQVMGADISHGVGRGSVRVFRAAYRLTSTNSGALS